jgi:creatinine amidohydrolase
VRLADATWPDLDPSGRLLAVPVGSCEQHGPHLPFDTDTTIAVALADGLANRRDDVTLAPAVAYGSSGEHAGFAGTLSVGQAAIELFVVELVRSADAWRGVVLVNGHGGNAEPIERATRLLQHEGRGPLCWWPRVVEGDLHAGLTETSLMLAIAPGAVREERFEPGTVASTAELLPALRTGGVRSVSANGVLGNPIGASAERGRLLFDGLVDDLTEAVARWLGGAPGQVATRSGRPA